MHMQFGQYTKYVVYKQNLQTLCKVVYLYMYSHTIILASQLFQVEKVAYKCLGRTMT